MSMDMYSPTTSSRRLSFYGMTKQPIALRILLKVVVQDVVIPQVDEISATTVVRISLEKRSSFWNGARVSTSSDILPILGEGGNWIIPCNETLSVTTNLFKTDEGLFQDKTVKLIVKYRKQALIGGEFFSTLGESTIHVNEVADTLETSVEKGLMTYPLSEASALIHVKMTAIPIYSDDDGTNDEDEQECAPKENHTTTHTANPTPSVDTDCTKTNHNNQALSKRWATVSSDSMDTVVTYDQDSTNGDDLATADKPQGSYVGERVESQSSSFKLWNSNVALSSQRVAVGMVVAFAIAVLTTAVRRKRSL